MSVAETVWEGAETLRGSLVAIDTLTPSEHNPRKGDVEALRASLRRFGQLRPVLVDDTTIVSGHHLTLAATAEGWTHVAVMQHAFATDDDRRAFLIADNRTHDLGAGYDDALLAAQLMALAEVDSLAGTGYSTDDLDALLASLKDLDTPPVIDADKGKREHRDPGIKEVVLLFDEERFAQVDVWLGIVERETGSTGTSDAVYSALKIAAKHLNG